MALPILALVACIACSASAMPISPQPVFGNQYTTTSLPGITQTSTDLPTTTAINGTTITFNATVVNGTAINATEIDTSPACVVTAIVSNQTCREVAPKGIPMSTYEANSTADSDTCQDVLRGYGVCVRTSEASTIHTATAINAASSTTTFATITPAANASDVEEVLTINATITTTKTKTLTYTFGPGVSASLATATITNTLEHDVTETITTASTLLAAQSSSNVNGTISGEIGAVTSTTRVTPPQATRSSNATLTSSPAVAAVSTETAVSSTTRTVTLSSSADVVVTTEIEVFTVTRTLTPSSSAAILAITSSTASALASTVSSSSLLTTSSAAVAAASTETAVSSTTRTVTLSSSADVVVTTEIEVFTVTRTLTPSSSAQVLAITTTSASALASTSSSAVAAASTETEVSSVTQILTLSSSVVAAASTETELSSVTSTLTLTSSTAVAVINSTSALTNSTVSSNSTLPALNSTASSNSSSSASNSTASATDVYTFYSGNGSVAAGWPAQSDWVDFDTMFTANMAKMQASCVQWGVANDTDDEVVNMHTAIQEIATCTGVDERFILATIMQESGGCVRVITTNYGVSNPGLMQSHDGAGTCNTNSAALSKVAAMNVSLAEEVDAGDDGSVQTPCPESEIYQMIEDGTAGTASGDGLYQCLQKQGNTDVSMYYRAARMYNGGSIAASGDLGEGCCTLCYASDIANRLTGWVDAPSTCTLS